ncbi:hypothetical protein ACLOJK_034142 [Asimina triloba]
MEESVGKQEMPNRLLRGGSFDYPNTLSPRQMSSLNAVCDALLPSIHLQHPENEHVRDFYATSATMAGTPQLLGSFLSGRLVHPAMGLLRLALWLLSTWYGTLLACGTASITREFPYVKSFPELTQERREQILLSWSLSSSPFHRMFFKCIKFVTLRVFFSQVDENNHNVSWKAIGYCGADPDFINWKKKGGEEKAPNGISQKEEEEEEEEQCFGPLYRALLDMEKPKEVIIETLKKAGFPISIHHGRTIVPSSSSSPCLSIHCDAVVVGSGSGGGVVAGVLAKAGYKVVVLEKGNYFARRSLSLLEFPTIDQMYEGNGLIATDNLGALFLAGSTVGGGSAVNWSGSIPTPAHVTDEWSRKLGLELFSSKAYQHALDAVCKRMGVESEVSEESLNNAVLRRGCLELGYPVKNVPRNSPADHHCGWCHLGCKDGRKQGTQETWLVDAVNSGNAVILPGCRALKVLQLQGKKEGGRKVAAGVVFECKSKNKNEMEIYVVESKVTVVACGALTTPVLLKKSGLRNAHIGKHLHIHPTVMAWGYFPPCRWPEAEKKSYNGGIMTAMSTVVSNFDTSGYGCLIQTPALHPGMFSVGMPWMSGLDMKQRMSRFSRTAHVFALVRDKGEGRVNYPKSLTYDLAAGDEENLNRALEKSLRILAAAGAEEIGTHHCKGYRLNVGEASAEEFERFVKEASSASLRDLSTPINSAHQMGSCRMGMNPKESAVNPRGETWEVEGLFVADTSVFPTALGVNPMVTVQAISYCTAQSVIRLLQRENISNQRMPRYR